MHILQSAPAQFEAAWSLGERPKLESYLDEASQAASERMFAQLLDVELRWRARRGEDAAPEEYQRRFPHFRRQIANVFESVGAATVNTPPVSVLSTSSFHSPAFAPTAREGGQEPDNGGGFGHFELFESLGEGSFGAVRRARDRRLDRDVALKMPRLGVLSDGDDVQRFLREARAAAQLRHPHIVPVHEAGQIDGVYYIASELIQGRTLRRALQSGWRPTCREAAGLIARMASALHYAHNKGIVHRDVKPENVMLDADGEPHMMDFGLARRDEPDMLRTQEGVRMGTPAYMSPEQAKGESHTADARSDLWSLGVMLYELLAGRRPFEGRGVAMLQAILEREPASPRSIKRSIRKDLETICLKCLAKRPEDRYPSCQHLADELERWLRGEPIIARPIAAPERLFRWCRRNPVTASLTGLVVASLLVGTAVSSYFAVEAGSQATAAFANAQQAEENARQARLQEHVAQRNAQQARDEQQRAKASEQLARRSEASARRSLYFADVDLARQLLEAGDVDRATSFLESHIPQPGEEDLRRFEWAYLWRLRHGESFTLPWAHPGDNRAMRQIRAVALAPGGKHILVGGGQSPSGEAKLYPLESDQVERSFGGKLPMITALAYSPDGAYLAAACGDQGAPGVVKIWDAATGEERLNIDAGDPVMSLAISPDGRQLFTAGAALIAGRGTPVDRYFNVAPAPRTEAVKVWDAHSGELLASMAGETGETFSVAVSPDGETIAAGDAGGLVHFWDGRTREKRGSVPTNLRYVWSLDFSPDGETLAVGAGFWDEPGAVSLYDVPTRELQRVLRGHQAGVTCVRFAPDGKLLASGSWDRTIKLWDLADRTAAATCRGHSTYVWTLGFTPDGKTLISGGWGAGTAIRAPSEVKIWDVPRQRRFTTVRGPLEEVGTYQFRDWAGSTVAAVYPTGNTLTIWDAATGAQRASFEPFGRSNLRSVSVSRDGGLVAAAGFTPSTKIWDAHTLALVAELDTGTVPYLTFSPDGSLLAIACDNGRVRIWDASTHQERPELVGHTDVVWWVDFSPDGERLVSGSWDHTIKLWDTQTGRLLTTLTGHNDVVWKVAFLHGEQTLLSATNSVGIWDGGLAGKETTGSEEASDARLPPHEIERAARSKWYALLAMTRQERGQSDGADRDYEQALEIIERRAEQCPPVACYRLHLFNEIVELRNFYALRGRRDDAARLVTLASSLLAQAESAELGTPQEQITFAQQLMALASLEQAGGDRHAGTAAMERAHRRLSSLAEDPPEDVDVAKALAACANAYAWMLAADAGVSPEDARRAVQLAEQATERAPEDGSYWNSLGVARYRAGQWQDAIDALERSCELRAGGDAFDWFFLAMAHWQLGKHAAAREHREKAREWMQKHAPQDVELQQFGQEAEELLDAAAADEAPEAPPPLGA